MIAVADETRGLLKRHHLLTQPAIARQRFLAQGLVGFDQRHRAHVRFASRPSYPCRHPAVGIESRDHLVPARHQLMKATPKVLRLATVEVGNANTLLLDPGEITEIENALTLAMARLEHVVVVGGGEVCANELGGKLAGHLARVVPPPEIAADL